MLSIVFGAVPANPVRLIFDSWEVAAYVIASFNTENFIQDILSPSPRYIFLKKFPLVLFFVQSGLSSMRRQGSQDPIDLGGDILVV